MNERAISLSVLAAALAFLAWRQWRGLLDDDAINQTPDLADDAAALTDAAKSLNMSTDDNQAASNRSAFLTMIATSEGTDQAGGYRCLFGSTTARPQVATSLADHPARLGWPGVMLSDALCAGAGLGPGCKTTAAGRYQFTLTTWKRLGYSDFSEAAQDSAALDLVRERGALGDVDAGRIPDAIQKVRKVWASLPGAGYKQGERDTGFLLAAYQSAGGTLA